jgi:hypothetical protein
VAQATIFLVSASVISDSIARILGGPIVFGIRCPDGDQWWPNSRAPDLWVTLSDPRSSTPRAQRPHCLAGVVTLKLEYPCASQVFEMA